jgi:PAS domain S-box-containing protein
MGAEVRSVRLDERTLRAVLEAAPDAIVVVDGTGRIVFVNAQTEKVFGYGRDELLGQAVEVLVPEAFRAAHPGHRAGYSTAARTRPMGMGIDLRGRRKNGTEFPVEISLSPIETDGELLIASAIRDVTDRRSADEAKLRLAAIVQSSDDAIVGKNLDGTIVSWNDGATRIFGYTADEAIGKPVTILWPPGLKDDEHAEHRILDRLKAGGHIEHFETLRRCKDGRDIDVSITMSPVRDASGNVIGASKVARDISDRKRAEEALATAKDAAETAARELEAFSYSVAHDLRAPLRAIDGFSQAVLEDYADRLDHEGRRYLTTVRESAQYMAQLIESLLMLARLTQSSLRQEPVDLSSLARSAVARLRSGQPRRQVECHIADGLVEKGDARLLSIALDNLFGNAWKFTEKRADPRIEFGRVGGEDGSVYFVKDNGAGFDMAYADKLFGVFQRLHSVGEFEGTGVGLATVQRIIRRHGGRIWAEAKVGEGATFWFTLNDREPRR